MYERKDKKPSIQVPPDGKNIENLCIMYVYILWNGIVALLSLTA